MIMKERVRITKILQMRSGVSQNTGNEWHTQQYIGEYYYDETHGYKKRILFEVFGKDRIEALALAEGEWYDVYFEIDVREYNGKYFTQISLYEATPVDVDADKPF